MKLPDFTADPDLLDLRKKMGANETVAFVLSKPNTLSQEELNALGREGIEVSYDEITFLADGTLAYKDSRVVVYIRDVSVYGGRSTNPKFHVFHCRTLTQMRENNRFDRYVVATRDDGQFWLRKDKGRKRKESWERLDVCQNCLDALNFENFPSLPYPKKMDAVKAFSIARFFEQFPKSLFIKQPTHSAMTAPSNEYTPDFSAIALRLKEKREWRCEKCPRDLSDQKLRKYLQVHHKNGLKYDNAEENLQVLCLECHSKEFLHSHMRGAALREFLKLVP